MDEASKQTEATEERKSSNAHGWGCAWLIGAASLILYVLSVGPVARYCQSRHTLPPRPVLSFYTPLAWVASRCSPLQSFLKWYVGDVWCANIHPAPSTPGDAGR